MSSDTPNPPWYVTLPDGDIDALAVPDRLLRHPELRQRGIIPDSPLKIGCVYCTSALQEPSFVVKILDRSMEEIAIYKRLLREPMASNNHTVPSEITTTDHPVLIMPLLGTADYIHPGRWSPYELVDLIYQIVEGIDFLHSLRIVHMDICRGNILGASPYHADTYKGVTANRVYIIDFNTSKQFALGPGVQRAITLPESQMQPPNGLQHFDPYSWDMYCVGRTIQLYVRNKYVQEDRPRAPWFIERYIQWLIGDEKGCTGVCRCRPTARTALRVIVFMRWALYPSRGYHWVADALARLWSPRARKH